MKLKTILLTFIPSLLLACSQTEAEPDMGSEAEDVLVSNRFLSPEEAGMMAGDFMASLRGEDSATRGRSMLGSASVELLNLGGLTRSEDSDTVFYVVNFEEGGYALVAADRDLENNVYVYSETDEFELDDNPVMKIYLENAIATLPDAPRHTENADGTSNATRAPQLPNPDEPVYGGEVEIFGVKYKVVYKNSHSVKKPLLTTLWHQEKPYNMCCPEINGLPSKVGCVAVAIGQICASLRFPKSIDGLTLDWEKMLVNSTHNNSSVTGSYEVADFLHRVGEKCKMNYGVKSSGATIDDAVSGLKSLGFTGVVKRNFSTSECVNSMQNNAPVYMRGGDFEGSGHAWVVDGYDSFTSWKEYYRLDDGEFYGSEGTCAYTYLHFNLGWPTSSSNTYYLCSGNDPGKKYEELSVFKYSEKNQIILYSR